MAENSKIAWTDHTFNSWWGCTKVPGDPACHNCYAEAFSKRVGFKIWGNEKPRRFLSDANWRKPIAWDRKAAEAGERHRVFCSSMADVFEDRRDLDPVRERLWTLIDETPNLDWLLLTKRPENIGGMLGTRQRENIWLGTTAVNQEWADKRVPELLANEAAVHFLSAEPLMGTLDLSCFLPVVLMPGLAATGGRTLLDWVIVGGESGPRHRTLDLDAVDSLRAQCFEVDVAFFMKQDSGRAPGGQGRIPDHLWVQQFPEAPSA